MRPSRERLNRWRTTEAPQRPQTPAQVIWAATLDALDAFGALDEVVRYPPPGQLLHGPVPVFGETWAGVVVWLAPQGYYGYRTLTLLGTWATSDSEGQRLTVGTRTLAYQPAFFSPEAYFRRIRQSFSLYYGREVPPPQADSACLGAFHFDAEERLAGRQRLRDLLAAWVQAQHTAPDA